jgi:hypothetical protein
MSPRVMLDLWVDMDHVSGVAFPPMHMIMALWENGA